MVAYLVRNDSMPKQSAPPAKIPLSIRIYHQLLKLYPSPFQEAFGPDMLQIFQDTYRAKKNRLGLVWLWAWALLDLGWSLPAEYVTEYQGDLPMKLQRVFDFTLATLALILCLPLFLLIAVLTWLDSGGPVFFRQERIGRLGQPFAMLKFRSMTNDDRREITRFGRILRQTCLDELPQLLNVIRGDMALIGPRPALSTEVSLDDPTWQQILAIRLGIAGLWQVSGQGSPTSPERFEADLHYLQHRGWRLNLRIFLKTIQTIFRARK